MDIAFQPTAIEMHREVGLGGWFDDREVWDFIGRNLYLMVKPDLRFYLHALQHKRAGHPWKDITLRMFESACEETGETREEREKQLYIARLLADPAYDECDAPEAKREAAFEFFFGRGGSRASYHRHKKKLLSLRGDFKLEDLIQCPWRANKDEPTEYDLRQTQIRATLENEKTELLRVGGVLGADGDDEDDTV